MATLRLKEMLKKRKMTRYRFAQELGVDYKNSARYFKPGYDPKLSMLSEFARVLSCRIRDLYKE